MGKIETSSSSIFNQIVRKYEEMSGFTYDELAHDPYKYVLNKIFSSSEFESSGVTHDL